LCRTESISGKALSPARLEIKPIQPLKIENFEAHGQD